VIKSSPLLPFVCISHGISDSAPRLASQYSLVHNSCSDFQVLHAPESFFMADRPRSFGELVADKITGFLTVKICINAKVLFLLISAESFRRTKHNIGQSFVFPYLSCEVSPRCSLNLSRTISQLREALRSHAGIYVCI
jgi:hypothetical protein